jgi:4,5-DOPA dioxygenase extradiol
MYPDADVPALQLSVQSRLDAAHHAALGRALAPLRDEGILVLGSGGATHDLRRLAWGAGPDDQVPPDVRAFEEWLVARIETGETAELVAWRTRAPHADANHPTPEHFLPLFVPLGAAPEGTRGRVLHRTFAYGALSMAAFAWD